MQNRAYSLQDLLDLEQLEVNLFKGQSIDLGLPQVFGGQVIGQALVAATRTVEDRHCHSLHSYFLRPGNPDLPIVYDVERLRDGRSFSTRRVVAIQNGEVIYVVSASFQVADEGLSHQVDMPQVAAPEDCHSEDQYFSSIGYKGAKFSDAIDKLRPIEMRRVEEISFVKPEPRPAFQHVWFRARNSLPENPELHQCVLAYATDLGILGSSCLPHGKALFTELKLASLDHSIWFHRPVKVDEWLLYAQDSPVSYGTRGFNRGSLFTQDGVLVASVVQEGLIRVIA